MIEDSPESAALAPVLHEFDIDGADVGDQFAVHDYTAEIFSHLRQAEVSPPWKSDSPDSEALRRRG